MTNATGVRRWGVLRPMVAGIALLIGGHTHATGIPVVDAAGLAQMLVEYSTLTEQLATLKSQYDTAVSQLQSLKEQASTLQSMYSDFSGISGHASMLPNVVSQLHSYIPAQLLNPSAMVNGELGGLISQLRAAQEKFTAADLFPKEGQAKERELYQAQSDQAFGYRANAQAAYAKFADRRQTLESLSTAATTAATPGAKLDLIAKAVAENSLLLNDIAQMMALQLAAQADRDILQHNQDGVTQAQRATVKASEMQFR
jgi:hypothetical protein